MSHNLLWLIQVSTCWDIWEKGVDTHMILFLIFAGQWKELDKLCSRSKGCSLNLSGCFCSTGECLMVLRQSARTQRKKESSWVHWHSLPKCSTPRGASALEVQCIKLSGPKWRHDWFHLLVLKMCLEKVSGLWKWHMVGLCLWWWPRVWMRTWGCPVFLLRAASVPKSPSSRLCWQLGAESAQTAGGKKACVSGSVGHRWGQWGCRASLHTWERLPGHWF